MRILAIETSCDDTGIAILEFDKNNQPKILADLVSSQIKIHAPFGGVVPMLAKREHQKNLMPTLQQALLKETKLLKNHESKIMNQESKILNSKFLILNSILEREPELLKKLKPFLKKYQKPDIDAIAVTIGPGLEPALWVGVNFARALGYFWNLPIIPVNHIEAHIAANFINNKIGGISNFPRTMNKAQVRGRQFPISNKLLNSDFQIQTSFFPAVCLVVSGGHTQLILMKKFGRYEILGETRDDAAGEAFDKLARMLNLGYPGGPIVAEIATKVKVKSLKLKVKLPRPMLNSDDYDFSFSGLKTAALYFVKTLDKKTLKKLTPAIAAEFQQAVVDVLVTKIIRAAKEFKAKTVLLSGGVAANNLLRDSLSLNTKHLSLNFLVPSKNFCTDNAVMIALAAYQKNQKKSSWQNLKADSNLRIN